MDTTNHADVLRYLREAAHVTGTEHSDEGKLTGKQAAYSLEWYFEHLIDADLNPASDSYGPLLNAYLQGNGIAWPKFDPAAHLQIDRQLQECFPRSEHPLNASQTKAVHMALTNPVTVILGPPGTGKTETILRILALATERGETVAMVSSNSEAVHNVEDKIEAVRVAGNAPQNDLLARLAERLVKLGKAAVRENACDASGRRYGFTTSAPEGMQRVHKDLAAGWEQNIRLDEFCRFGDGTARCITSTINSLKKCFVDGDKNKFDLVVIDEASQASVVSGIVAMSAARRIVVVGDDEQLPPVVSEALRAELESALEAGGAELVARLADTPFDVANASHPVSFLGSCREVFCKGEPAARPEVLLNEHYRCHPGIIGFCNEYVYDNQLTVRTARRPGAPAFPIGIRWYEGDYRERDVRWCKDKMGAGRWRGSVCNQRQLSIVAHEELPHIRELIAKGKSICFLTPFWAQAQALVELFQRVAPDVAQELGLGLGADDDEERSQAECALDECSLTVHKSQGREYDCVYLLPVEDGKWAWPWSQGRRLVNVAVSRAKEELHVIVSAKLMYDEDQLRLAGRVTKPDDEIETLADEAQERENLFVCKLVNYVLRHEGEWSAEGEPDWCGVHRARTRSVFDWSANLQGSFRDEGRDKHRNGLFVPEALVVAGLAHLNVEGVEGGIGVAHNVSLKKLCWGDKTLDDEFGERFTRADLVHLDFVVFSEKTHQVLALVEVDGEQHRYKNYRIDGGDGRRSSSANGEQGRERDWEKERLVRELGGTCAWLGEPNGHQLVKVAMTGKERQGQRVIPGDHDAEGRRLGEGDARNRLDDWVSDPLEIPETSSFVFLRIPADGSTAFEFDALREDAAVGLELLAPTVDEFVRAQASCGGSGKALTIEGRSFVYCPGRKSSRKTITGVIERSKSKATAESVNKRLVAMGILREDADTHNKVPTELGRFLGISLVQPKGQSYVMCEYDLTAQQLVRPLL